ncbi:MAG: CBS domain-containing protein [Nitrospirae bacterium]|nr:CBS domain-containing protein [Nitrospirota bacterium]
MTCIAAKNIMHPRVSLYAKTKGEEVIERLMSSYPALPVVDDELRVMGVVSEFDVLTALKEGRTVHEFSAESLMTCGHSEHGACDSPVTVQPNTEIEDIVDLFIQKNVSILPVVEKGKLVGIISRKNIMNALAEKGFWKEHEFKKRA